MKLTGKAKRKFEKWYFSLPNAMGLNYGTIALTMNRFYSLPESMQWGIIQDWADSIGYDMMVEGTVDDNLNYTKHFEWSLLNKKNNSSHYDHNECKTRQEARNAAIEKLNEIINKK